MARGRAVSFDPRVFLATVGKGTTAAEYRKNEIVFSQGDPADAVFYIQRGRVQLAVVSARGREVVVSRLGAGAFFGEGCLAVRNLRTATASALTNCRIVRMDRAAMLRGLANQPGFSAVFIAHLLAHGIRIEEDLVDHLLRLQREAAGARPLVAGQLRQGGAAGAGDPQGQPGDIGGDDRRNPLAGQLPHEQIPPAGLHRLRRRTGSAQLAAEGSAARLTP